MSQASLREPEEKSAEMVAFEACLRSKNLKVTTERMGILKAVFARQDHVDAETLQAELRSQGISRATIYRTLDLLVQCGLVRRHNLGANHAVYEADFGAEHHDHMVCIECREVTEFLHSGLETLQETVCEAHGFRPLRHNLQIFGLCRSCAKVVPENQISARLAQFHG